jgi:predicted phage terminase large subunit-like protein
MIPRLPHSPHRFDFLGEQRRALVRALRRLRSKQNTGNDALDLIAWGQAFLPKHFTAPPSAMHRWLADELGQLRTSRGTKLNVVGPRGGAKSTVATLAYVLRAAVSGWEPYIWIVSDTITQANMHLANVKAELANNPLLTAAYPDAAGNGGKWQAGAIELKNGVAIEAYSTGQRLRGRRHGEYRPTLIVCDDIQNDSHMSSPTQRESSHEWFHGALLKSGTPSTNIINLATALHRDALAMQLQTTPGWRSELFRAIVTWPTRDDLWHEWEQLYTRAGDPDAGRIARAFYHANRAAMDLGAEVLWPEVEDLYTLMAMRVESGRTAFEREKQGAPIDPDGCEWPEEYFGDHLWFDEWPESTPIRVVALDPSKGADSNRGDYSAFVMLAIDSEGTLWVEADLARRPTPQMVTDGVAICDRFKPHLFGVEANQWQELLAAEFTAEFERQGRYDIHPAMIHNQTNKHLRIRRLGPYLSRRKLKFYRHSYSTRLLVDQLHDFPGSAHDDGPDALEMALRMADELRQTR